MDSERQPIVEMVLAQLRRPSAGRWMVQQVILFVKFCEIFQFKILNGAKVKLYEVNLSIFTGEIMLYELNFKTILFTSF